MSVKILSFNVLAEQFIDYSDLSADYPGIPANVLKFNKRIPKIIAYLERSKADVILLQEITPLTSKVFKAKFKAEYWIMPLALHHTDEAQEKGNAYGNLTMIKKPARFVDKSAVAVKAVEAATNAVLKDVIATVTKATIEKHSEPKTEGKVGGKGATKRKKKVTKGGADSVVEFTKPSQRVYRVPLLGTAFSITEMTAGKQRVSVINIHLDSDEKTEKKRREEIKLLMEFITPLLKISTVILTGDFNTNNAATHKKFSNLTPVVKKETGTYLNHKPMIDWIYVANAKIIEGYVDRPAKADATAPFKQVGSDHWPVVGIVELPQTDFPVKE